MLKANRIVSALAISALLGLSAFAKTPTPQPTAKTTAKTAKPKPTPKPDSEIQTCIEQKLAAAPKLKDQHFAVAVAGGAATFTGRAVNAGSKGAVDSIARSCGAKKVVNNITVEKAVKTATTTPTTTKPTTKPK